MGNCPHALRPIPIVWSCKYRSSGTAHKNARRPQGRLFLSRMLKPIHEREIVDRPRVLFVRKRLGPTADEAGGAARAPRRGAVDASVGGVQSRDASSVSSGAFESRSCP